MNAIRSLIHLLFMAVTVVPWALVVVLASLFTRGDTLYALCMSWLRVVVWAGGWMLGIRNQVIGFENLPVGRQAPAILLAKHQSTWETFSLPSLMPNPLAYVFKKELLSVPFFGWAIGRLDMIHIDRSNRTQSFFKVVQQGKALMDRGVWVIMFPEGTRIPRGQQGTYKSGGTRLAVETGVPVIPIAIASGRCWPRQALIKRPGTVVFSIGQPISSQGRDPDELMREVEAWIETEMRRIDPQAYPQPETRP